MAFEGTMDAATFDSLTVVSRIVDYIFLVDVVLNFRTGYIDTTGQLPHQDAQQARLGLVVAKAAQRHQSQLKAATQHRREHGGGRRCQEEAGCVVKARQVEQAARTTSRQRSPSVQCTSSRYDVAPVASRANSSM